MGAIVELEPFFSKFGCSELLISEYRDRALGAKPNRLYRCPKLMSGNIFYADVNAQSTITIYKYTSQWDEYKTIVQGAPRCDEFSLAFHSGKLYIMGGKVSCDTYSDAVSIHLYFDMKNIHKRISMWKIIFLVKVESLDLSTWNRETLPNMGESRSFFLSVSCDKYIYVIGGRNKSGCMHACERCVSLHTIYNRLNLHI